jgi:hypothetical protein
MGNPARFLEIELTARPLSVAEAMREIRDPVSAMAQKLPMLLAVEVPRGDSTVSESGDFSWEAINTAASPPCWATAGVEGSSAG